MLSAAAGLGCAAPFCEDLSSVSLGTHADGALRRPAVLPIAGDGYLIPAPWRQRSSNYGTDELVGLVTRASRSVAREHGGGVVAVGDLSRRTGGASAEHKSHHNGRDVDLFYYAVDKQGRPVSPGDAAFRFNGEGRAVRWSPARGMRAPARAVPAHRFDSRRNWSLIRALLSDPEAEVQWIFIHRSLAALMMREAAARGEDPAVLARAAFVLREPSDAEPHDDHMHIRLYCDPADRVLGCADRGPVRWWKKMWKYMAPPYGRAADGTMQLFMENGLLETIRGELPALLFRAPLQG